MLGTASTEMAGNVVFVGETTQDGECGTEW